VLPAAVLRDRRAQQLFAVCHHQHLADNVFLFVSSFTPRMAGRSVDVTMNFKMPKWVDKIMLSDENLKHLTESTKKSCRSRSITRRTWHSCFPAHGPFRFAHHWTPKVFMPSMDQGQS